MRNNTGDGGRKVNFDVLTSAYWNNPPCQALDILYPLTSTALQEAAGGISEGRDMENSTMTKSTIFTEAQTEALNDLGGLDGSNLLVALTDEQYEMDDDDPDSVISGVKEALGAGYTAEWGDDYDPQENGKTTVTIRIRAINR